MAIQLIDPNTGSVVGIMPPDPVAPVPTLNPLGYSNEGNLYSEDAQGNTYVQTWMPTAGGDPAAGGAPPTAGWSPAVPTGGPPTPQTPDVDGILHTEPPTADANGNAQFNDGCGTCRSANRQPWYDTNATIGAGAANMNNPGFNPGDVASPPGAQTLDNNVVNPSNSFIYNYAHPSTGTQGV